MGPFTLALELATGTMLDDVLAWMRRRPPDTTRRARRPALCRNPRVGVVVLQLQLAQVVLYC